MLNRLIELLKDAEKEWEKYIMVQCAGNGEIPKTNRVGFSAGYLLENGVIVLPCKLGNTLFDISEFFDDTTNSPEIYRYKVEYINIYKKYPDKDELCFEIDGIDAKFDDFGKTLFFSEKEAEKALKRGMTDV